MPIKISVPSVTTPTRDQALHAELTADEFALLGRPVATAAGPSVVLLPADASLNDGGLEFDPSRAVLLNRGAGTAVLLVRADDERQQVSEPHRFGPLVQRDDGKLLEEFSRMPTALHQLGVTIVKAVQDAHPGHFQLTSSGRYIYRPNNFWTIKPQHRDGSLRITVYGTPERLSPSRGVELKADQNSYTTFKVSNPDQADSAIGVLMRSAALKAR
jgi:hypothetical protein